MLSSKKLIFIFVPAILVAGLALFVRIIQYQPLYSKDEEQTTDTPKEFTIPFLPQDPILGNKKSALTIVAFEDFACPACKQQETILANLQKEYPEKFKIVWKGLPVTEFPHPSETAHLYGYCAQQQKKFEEFKAYAFNNETNLSASTLDIIAGEINLDLDELKTCLENGDPKAYIEGTKSIALMLNIQAVPTFFIDNKQIKTPATEQDWKIVLGL
ncbi:MAG: thioredoxin domain-containing protein [Candidatus Magasanikbacteria bacterium]